MNSLVLAPFSDDALAALRELGHVTYEPWTATQTLHDPEELGQRLASEDIAVLIVEADFLFKEMFEAAGALRFAAICRAALNQVDLEAATETGVVVVHTPGRNARAVAELVLGDMLALARNVPQAERYVREQQWQNPTEPYLRFQGRELGGATLGVIGLGEIGRHVSALANGVGMRVLAYDPYVARSAATKLSIEITSLERLFMESDFISVHVPENDETLGMIGATQLALMKPTAYLVNVTSTGVVAPLALAAALRDKTIAGAALDVHEAHPIPPDSPFLELSTVLLTPHIGGATVETIARHSQMVADDLRLFIADKPPAHLANPDVWERRRP
jgi:D-3-phosphoglycerate dehydrogenase